MVPPAQTLGVIGLLVKTTFRFKLPLMVTVTKVDELQVPFEPVTVYVVVTLGLTIAMLPVAPVLQEYVLAPATVKVALPPQTVWLGAVSVGQFNTLTLVTVFTIQLPFEPLSV